MNDIKLKFDFPNENYFKFKEIESEYHRLKSDLDSKKETFETRCTFLIGAIEFGIIYLLFNSKNFILVLIFGGVFSYITSVLIAYALKNQIDTLFKFFFKEGITLKKVEALSKDYLSKQKEISIKVNEITEYILSYISKSEPRINLRLKYLDDKGFELKQNFISHYNFIYEMNKYIENPRFRKFISENWDYYYSLKYKRHYHEVERGKNKSSVQAPKNNFNYSKKINDQNILEIDQSNSNYITEENPFKNLKSKFVKKIDWIALQKSNMTIGKIGEEIVIAYEKTKLELLNKEDKIHLVEHTSLIHGDGMGYDIKSINQDDEVIYIEVKATKGNFESDLYLSETEYLKSIELKEKYYLYRVFNIDTDKMTADINIYSAEELLINFTFSVATYRLKINK